MTNTTLEKWEEKTLGELCDVLDSRRKPITKKDRVAGVYPYYGATGILDYVSGWIFDEELVLLGEDGAKWTSGEQSAFKINGKTWVNNHAHVLRPKRDRISDNYLIYNLNFQNLMPYITGTTVPKLNQEKMRSITIPLPPLPEQERIVAKLDKAFEAIDKVKANAEQNLNNAKELFNDTLDSKIRTLYKNSSTQKLSEVCDVRDGTHDSPKYLDKRGHPFVTSKNLKNDKIDMEKITYISDSDFEKINERSKVDIGDVLFAMIGTIGNPVVITEEPDFAIKNVALFKNINKLEPQYLKFLLKSPSVLLKMQLEANGTTQKFVSLKYLRNFMVPVPSLSEQQKIVEKLDVLQEQTKQLEAIYTQKIKECDELKQSILQKAFRGEL